MCAIMAMGSRGVGRDDLRHSVCTSGRRGADTLAFARTHGSRRGSQVAKESRDLFLTRGAGRVGSGDIDSKPRLDRRTLAELISLAKANSSSVAPASMNLLSPPRSSCVGATQTDSTHDANRVHTGYHLQSGTYRESRAHSKESEEHLHRTSSCRMPQANRRRNRRASGRRVVRNEHCYFGLR